MFPRLPLGKWLALAAALLVADPRPAAAQTAQIAPAAPTAPAAAPRTYPEHGYGFRCAFDSVQDAAWRRDPAGRAQYQAFLRQAQAAAAPDALARQQTAPDVTVPVVVHVIHTGGADNVTDAQVLDALRVVNLDFSKTNRDTADVIAAFRGRYANVGFRFRLARLDPSGNCTTGITRTFSTDTNVGDDRVKALITWDQGRYLNIWVCQAANGAGGYAYLPCSGGSGDGIVIRNAQFGSIGTSGGGNAAVRSLTHEIGHHFGLPHTWGGSNTPGLASNCNIDDGIADTPNTIGTGGNCGARYGSGTVLNNFNPCGPLANVQNYMDYSGCTRMFTTGQRAVMRAALALGCRNRLTTAANLLATGTNDGYVPVPCAPVVAFRSSAPTVCAGGTVGFVSDSYNADLAAPGVAYAWQFAGGVPATSALANPSVTYPTAGQYDVTLRVTAAGATGTLRRAALVTVSGPGTGLRAPLAESFENPGFPLNFAAPDFRNWASAAAPASGAARWERRAIDPTDPNEDLVVPDGTACVRVRSGLLPSGTVTTLTSPNLDLSAFSAANPPTLRFSRAYAIRAGAAAERLDIQTSTDCGATWQNETGYGAAALATVAGPQSGFSPDSLRQWQPLAVLLDDPAYLGRAQFLLRFALTSRQGNDFFLDDVRLGVPAAPSATRAAAFAAAGLHLAPNPYTPETTLGLTLQAATRVSVQLTDALGRVLGTADAGRLAAGPHRLPLPATGLAPGLYVVRVLLDGQPHAARLLVP